MTTHEEPTMEGPKEEEEASLERQEVRKRVQDLLPDTEEYEDFDHEGEYHDEEDDASGASSVYDEFVGLFSGVLAKAKPERLIYNSDDEEDSSCSSVVSNEDSQGEASDCSDSDYDSLSSGEDSLVDIDEEEEVPEVSHVMETIEVEFSHQEEEEDKEDKEQEDPEKELSGPRESSPSRSPARRIAERLSKMRSGSKSESSPKREEDPPQEKTPPSIFTSDDVKAANLRQFHVPHCPSDPTIEPCTAPSKEEELVASTESSHETNSTDAQDKEVPFLLPVDAEISAIQMEESMVDSQNGDFSVQDESSTIFVKKSVAFSIPEEEENGHDDTTEAPKESNLTALGIEVERNLPPHADPTSEHEALTDHSETNLSALGVEMEQGGQEPLVLELRDESNDAPVSGLTTSSDSQIVNDGFEEKSDWPSAAFDDNGFGGADGSHALKTGEPCAFSEGTDECKAMFTVNECETFQEFPDPNAFNAFGVEVGEGVTGFASFEDTSDFPKTMANESSISEKKRNKTTLLAFMRGAKSSNRHRNTVNTDSKSPVVELYPDPEIGEDMSDSVYTPVTDVSQAHSEEWEDLAMNQLASSLTGNSHSIDTQGNMFELGGTRDSSVSRAKCEFAPRKPPRVAQHELDDPSAFTVPSAAPTLLAANTHLILGQQEAAAVTPDRKISPKPHAFRPESALECDRSPDPVETPVCHTESSECDGAEDGPAQSDTLESSCSVGSAGSAGSWLEKEQGADGIEFTLQEHQEVTETEEDRVNKAFLQATNSLVVKIGGKTEVVEHHETPLATQADHAALLSRSADSNPNTVTDAPHKQAEKKKGKLKKMKKLFTSSLKRKKKPDFHPPDDSTPFKISIVPDGAVSNNEVRDEEKSEKTLPQTESSFVLDISTPPRDNVHIEPPLPDQNLSNPVKHFVSVSTSDYQKPEWETFSSSDFPARKGSGSSPTSAMDMDYLQKCVGADCGLNDVVARNLYSESYL